jgi:hypothetical protein
MEAAISQWASSFSEIFFNVENLNTIQVFDVLEL